MRSSSSVEAPMRLAVSLHKASSSDGGGEFELLWLEARRRKLFAS
uniref:Uncharacterized protein n=1 Tax=Arundo donax TaxID=35708 RepID=A0A0A8XXZ2_ARUDO